MSVTIPWLDCYLIILAEKTESGSDSDKSDHETADSTPAEVESTPRIRRFRAAVTSSDPQIGNNTPEHPAPTTSSTQATSKTAALTQLQPPRNCLTTFCFVRNTDPQYENLTDNGGDFFARDRG